MFTTPYTIDFSKRDPHSHTDAMFYQRWSPRSFKKVEIPEDIRTAIFDAARWSPSAYNEQPFRIIANEDEDDFERFRNLLIDFNKTWTKNASILGFFIAKNNLEKTGKPNLQAMFDTGFAWASISFQANKFGLYTHAMAGFKSEDSYKEFNIDNTQYTILAAFAIGQIDVPDALPDNYQKLEVPSSRKKLEEIYFPGAKHFK